MLIQTPLFAVYFGRDAKGRRSLEVRYGGAMLLIAIFAIGYVVGKGGLL